MAEAVVLGEEHGLSHAVDGIDVCLCGEDYAEPHPSSASLTLSGRVRLRVVRRSYSGGEKPVVDVAPDRLVVLKALIPAFPDPVLPPSPLPTQAEENRQRIENLIETYTADLRATEVPDRHYYNDWTLNRFHSFAASRLAELREELRKLDE